MVRSNSEVRSQMPTFGVVRSTDFPDWLLVSCPRSDCGETFLVLSASWRAKRTYETFRGEKHVISGRACPYCFRPARAPRSIPRAS